MSRIDTETKRKLREMGAAPMLEALEAQDETLVLGMAFEKRLRLVVDEAHSGFNHAKIEGLIRPGRTMPPGRGSASARPPGRVNRPGNHATCLLAASSGNGPVCRS